ncbi:hypothetical protein K505DRAFT_378710 [Melanomma pulvis-pyrius CBS 109.77]|uniref:PXA domain-containing protein n=1 Tax=Melanomma pulvis-pyrius CBS 109.77 TaxID=1314802 RepID=A0A6A6WXS4_9PLEO|nr:hypothetical protein K505DRAFT_378710 [Melanomma pulvis-pyrius CBS 109.77]
MSDSIQPAPPSSHDELAHKQSPVPPAPAETAVSKGQKDAITSSNAPAVDVKALTDNALHFLATASNETLGACLVGLSAGTYLVLGRVGLLLIGVMGGVVLHASWEGHTRSDGEDKSQGQGQGQGDRKRERGLDVVHRVLDWRDTRTHATEKSDEDESSLDVKLYSGKDLDYSDFRPKTAAALTELTDAVIRDYVRWWYSPVLPTDNSFPVSCRQTLTAFLISVSSHVSRKRPADNFVDFVTRSSSFMIIFFQELSAALAVAPGDPATEAVDMYLRMNRESTLANILDSNYQMKQFDMAAEDILQNYLEAKTYNCKPAQTFLKEILSKVVLEMIVVTCSKPEWINAWIVYLLEDGEPELMEAIDAGVEDSAGQLPNVKGIAEKRQQALDALEAGESANYKKHKRVVSRAQEAMDEAMREAQRLSQMIAEEDAKRFKDPQNASSSTLNDDQSESTTQGIVTPTSSQSETHADNDGADLGISNLPVQIAAQVAPHSPPKVLEEEEEPKQGIQHSFTSFDQILPNKPPTALMANAPLIEKPPPLTLHNSKMSIFDDAMPGEKTIIKNKPSVEYLIQIEPASHHHTGWMTARKFTDFETLHEVIRRIAAITGTTGFTEAHPSLPAWKGHTKASFRGELERYLNDAVRFKPLAESEGMRRFLEKEMGSGKSPGGKGFPGIGWPGQTFENMGKGMLDALTKAPNNVAGGGKAILGGVTGVLGSVTAPLGGKKRGDSVSSSPARAATAPTPAIQNRHGRAESTVSELPTHIRTESTIPFTKRASTDSLRLPNSPIIDQQPGREAPMERRPSYNPDGDGKQSGRSSIYGASRSNSRAPSTRASMDDLSPVMGGDQILNLPPIPSDIPDDYTSPTRKSLDPYYSRASTTSLPLPADPIPPLPRRPSATSLASTAATSTKSPPKSTAPKTYAPLSEQETTVLIELFFAVINELYTLSSAWNIRRTLLNAAKTFLLRPGNPQLTSIQQLLQSTVLDENTSDAGIAYHLRKIRENSLPTTEELKNWPAAINDEEKEKLRVKARKLLVERGMPQALTSVMGQAASGEALGRVFDCLQVERVGRGVIFGLVLQGLRAITQ